MTAAKKTNTECKPWLNIRILVCGQWECVTTRPGRRFYPGTARMVPVKQFPVTALEKAKAFAEAAGYSTYEIIRLDAPDPGSRTYNQSVVFTTQPTP